MAAPGITRLGALQKSKKDGLGNICAKFGAFGRMWTKHYICCPNSPDYKVHIHDIRIFQRMTNILDLWVTYLKHIQRMCNVWLAYKPYVGIRTQLLNMLKILFCLDVCQRMPACASGMPLCLEHLQPMSNVTLAYGSAYQRMRDTFHTLAYASTIPNSVIPP